MSFINDALNKVQKEKESPYAAYGDVLSSAGGKSPGKGRKPLVIMCAAAALLVVAGAAVLFGLSDGRKVSRPALKSPVLSAAAPGPVQAVNSRQEAPAAQAAVPALPAGKALEQKAEGTRPIGIQKEEPKPAAITTGDGPVAVASDAETIFARALKKQQGGDLEAAKELYKQVIRIEPRHLQALNNLGVVYMKMKRYKWAAIRLTDALNVKPDYVDAHYNLACLYARKNDTKQSLYYLKNAIEMSPEVKQWASRDDDLKNLARLPEFNKILQQRDN